MRDVESQMEFKEPVSAAKVSATGSEAPSSSAEHFDESDGKQSSDELSSDEQHEDEHVHSSEQLVDENLQADEQSLDEQRSDDQRLDEQLLDEQHLDEQHSDDQHLDEQFSDEQQLDEQNSDEQRLNEQHFDEQHLDEQNSDEQRVEAVDTVEEKAYDDSRIEENSVEISVDGATAPIPDERTDETAEQVPVGESSTLAPDEEVEEQRVPDVASAPEPTEEQVDPVEHAPVSESATPEPSVILKHVEQVLVNDGSSTTESGEAVEPVEQVAASENTTPEPSVQLVPDVIDSAALEPNTQVPSSDDGSAVALEDVDIPEEVAAESVQTSEDVIPTSDPPPAEQQPAAAADDSVVTETFSLPDPSQIPSLDESHQQIDSAAEAGEHPPPLSEIDDDKLKGDLDGIDGILEQLPRDALEMYGQVLAVFPLSPRANYGKAKVLSVISSLEQNDLILEESISQYIRMFSLPNVPKTLMVTAARELSHLQTIRGWISEACQTLSSLTSIYPDDLELHIELGLKYMQSGFYEHARTTFIETLNKDLTNDFAMVYLGYIMKLIDKELEQSLKFMKAGLATAPIDDLKFYVELGEALTRGGRHAEAHEVYQWAVDRGLLASVWQRSWYNAKGLTEKPWWTSEELGGNLKHLQTLEDFYTTILEEASEILVNKSYLFVSESRDVIESGEWKHMKLYINGHKVVENCDHAVKTCSLLDAFANAVTCTQCEVKLSYMPAGLHSWPHCGPTNCRLTGHLGLRVDPESRIRVADFVQIWTSGRFIVFDDSFEQEIWSVAESYNLILIVQMWHPQLNEDLKAQLGPL